MTGREIAAVAQVSARTVRRVARELYPAKHSTGRAATYSREEAVAIMARLRKPGFVQPGSQVDKLSNLPGQYGQLAKAAKLPAGIQLREIRLLAEKGLLARSDVRILLGLEHSSSLPAPPESPASPELAERAFSSILASLETGSGLPPGTVERVARAAAGAARWALKAIEGEAEANRIQGRFAL